MPQRPIRLRSEEADSEVRAGLDRIRQELAVPGAFPAAVMAEAVQAARQVPSPVPETSDLPFFTLDPPGSMDLDQAMHLERRGSGYRVHYAIADVASFVQPGGAIDAESHARGVTLYLPDVKAPLHPPQLSEAAASLLPGQQRPAVVWTIDLGGDGTITGVDVRRRLVTSRERLDYDSAQRAATADPRLALLAEIGTLLLEAEAERGGVSLPVPEQEVVRGDDGWELAFRGGLPSEAWNAQISLLTGRAAAGLMLDGGIGLLRTMPPPPAEAVSRLRRSATALGIGWPEDRSYGEVVRGLDPSDSRHAAFLHEAVGLMRGAGYTAFEGITPDDPAALGHAAVAASYAHVTAPLRRLADRYAAEICLALTAGGDIPDWVRSALHGLPDIMRRSLQRSASVDRACVDLVEALLLRDHVGEVFDAVVVDVSGNGSGGLVQLLSPAVLARCDGDGLPLGGPVKVRLTESGPVRRQVRFTRTV
ncbi:RNB domain-containing ribonuclease [Actinomadura rudentiformis]|uniref:RNB domain-containing ribonuclease n=1 Tax=Actinomadura rudentiformis TaxID=359158 RepID=A0A6H9Z2Q8_9ACTN|nr:RNB domain-containing ribonuclease [Actinomadura rudentiformis]KAB2348969.1 RNB domain-containing ribonuclease [Actinomadura rudentiformis]